MIEHEIYNKGSLVVTRVSGVVKGQDLIDHVFWLIDSHNIGEVRDGFSQLIYAGNLQTVELADSDIYRVANISMGLGRNRGKFRTAIVVTEPYDMRLAHLHKSLAESADLEVEICPDIVAAFQWLGIDNPDPARFS